MNVITPIVIGGVATALLAIWKFFEGDIWSFFGGGNIKYTTANFFDWLIIFLFFFAISCRLPIAWHTAIRGSMISGKEVIFRWLIGSQRMISNANDRRALQDKDAIITGLLTELSRLNNTITEKNQQIHKLARINITLKENIDRLRSDVETLKASRPISPSVISDRKFISVKREFAKMYHPNNPGFTGMEKVIRGELFKEFWQVLERIEAT